MLQNILRHLLTLSLLVNVLVFSENASADVVVIVSARSEVTSLTAEKISRIFLGKTDVFPDGSNATPIDQAEGSAIKEEFYSKVLNMNLSQLKAYWTKIIFTGDGRPPKLLESNISVKRAVARNPNAIGYIEKNTVDSSVRVILTY